MIEIQDVKQIFGQFEWARRVNADPRRIYAFLLASDEQKDFLAFLQDAWRSLDSLSGEACDIFTFEQGGLPGPHPNFLPLPNDALGGGRYISDYELPAIRDKMLKSVNPDPRALQEVTYLARKCTGQRIWIDNGLRIPDRHLCYEIRDKLFRNSESIILPGLAIFASPDTVDATYISCIGLNSEQLSNLFQRMLNLIRSVYRSNVQGDRFDIYEAVCQRHRRDQLKGKVIKAVSTLTIKDLFGILRGIAGGIFPSTPKRARKDETEWE